MKTAIVFVAHPDDCIIFCQHFITMYCQEYNFEIVYLTHAADDERIAEITRYWAAQNVSVRTFGMEDNSKDMAEKRINVRWFSVHRPLADMFSKCDLVLTHGSNGEYGHPHHIFCHFVARAAMNESKAIFVTIARDEEQADLVIDGNIQIDSASLPLHYPAISGFNEKLQCLKVGRYKIYANSYTSPPPP